jgi:hypothetical protein
MSIFEKISAIFKAPIQDYSYWITVRCKRCGEIIKARVDLRNDPSINYDDERGTVYYCRKVLIGEEYCFEKIEVELIFDANRKLIDRHIVGGEFIDEEAE